MAEEIIGLKVELDTSGASAPMASLKSQIKEATNELVHFTDKFGSTSKEAINAAKRVAELKDRMGDAKQMVDAFNPDAKFNALTQSIQGAAGAFQAVQGAMGLFGAESENTQKALLKVQSAMAFSQGLSSFLDGGIEGFRNLYRVISTNVVAAFTALKAAIGSTGIGLLVIAIAAIAANWDKIKTAVSGVTSEQRKLNEAGRENLKKEEDKLKHLSDQDNVLKLQGKSEKQILDYKIQQIAAVIKATEKQIESEIAMNNAAVEAAVRNKAILISILDIVQYPIIKLLEGIDAIGSAFGKEFNLANGFKNLEANLLFDPEQIKKDGDETVKALKEQLAKLKNEEAGFKLSQIKIDKKDDKKGKTDIEILKEKYASELLAAQEFHLTNIEKEEDYEKKKLAITEKYLKTKLGTNAQTHVELLNAQKDINAKLIELDKQVEEEPPVRAIAAQEEVRLLLDTEGNYVKEKEAIDFRLLLAADSESKRRKANIELAKLEKEQKIQALEATANTLNGVAELLGKQTTAGKVAAVASATIETFLSAQKAYSATIGIPIVGPTLAPINAALAIATGVANVKKILAVKTPDGGGNSGGNISASTAPNAPSATVFNTTTKLNKDSIDKINDKAVKAYVVETDINNGQKRIERILINTKFK